MCEYTGEDIYDEISSIRDPEKPFLSLADLNVVAIDRCQVAYLGSVGPVGTSCEAEADHAVRRKNGGKRSALVTVTLLPTVPHCHLMNIICLSVVARLLDTLPLTTSWKFRILLVDGSHHTQREIERQANDRERVAAALENPIVFKEVSKLINPFGSDT